MHGREVHTKFQLENLKETDQSEDLGIGERIILKWSLKKYDGSMCRVRI
jgi:hypothetical protein